MSEWDYLLNSAEQMSKSDNFLNENDLYRKDLEDYSDNEENNVVFVEHIPIEDNINAKNYGNFEEVSEKYKGENIFNKNKEEKSIENADFAKYKDNFNNSLINFDNGYIKGNKTLDTFTENNPKSFSPTLETKSEEKPIIKPKERVKVDITFPCIIIGGNVSRYFISFIKNELSNFKDGIDVFCKCENEIIRLGSCELNYNNWKKIKEYSSIKKIYVSKDKDTREEIDLKKILSFVTFDELIGFSK